MALSWINIQAELEESGRGANWPVYQLFLKGMDDIEAVRHVRKLATLSHPVRCRLGRVYNELFDNRFIVWSERSKWSNYWWSFESSVDDNGLLVSLGKRHPAFAGPLNVQAESHLTSRYMMYARYVYDCWRWSFSRWSDAFSRRHGFLVGSVLTVGPQRQEQPWRFRWRSLTRAQLTWAGANGKTGTWGDINCRWGTPAYPILDDPALWGKVRWGDLQRHKLVVTPEKFEATQMIAVPADFVLMPVFFSDSVLTSVATARNRREWSLYRWSEAVPRQHGFLLHSGLVGNAVRLEYPWRLYSQCPTEAFQLLATRHVWRTTREALSTFEGASLCYAICVVF